MRGCLADHGPTGPQRARVGVHLGFVLAPETSARPNYASGECDDVTKEMDRFEASGFLEKGPVLVNNPMAYIAKKEAGTGRIITDMNSHP